MAQINIANVFLLLLTGLLIGGSKPLYRKTKNYIYGDPDKKLYKEHIAIFAAVYIFIMVLFNINYEHFLTTSLTFKEPANIWYKVLTNAYQPIYKLQQFDSFPEYFDEMGWTYFNPSEPLKPSKPVKLETERDQDFKLRQKKYEEDVKTYKKNLAQYKEDKVKYDQQWDTFEKENIINTPRKAYRDISTHSVDLNKDDGYKYLMDVESFQMLLNSQVWKDNQIGISNALSDDIFTSGFIVNLYLNERTAFFLPNSIALLIPALFFSIVLVRFIYLPLKTPKIYLAELRNINRFTAFLNYNVKFNNNESNLLTESLKGIEQDYFFDFAGKVFTSETIASKEKYEEVTNVFNFQFLSLYFSLFQVMLNEGVSNDGLAALDLAQFQGEKYYKSIDMLFQAKKSALGSVKMVIVVIGGAVPLLTKKNVTDLYLCYLYSNGYTPTIIFYCVLLGIFAISVKTYADNKIIRKEGRYI